jgi:hypothetical protein
LSQSQEGAKLFKKVSIPEIEDDNLTGLIVPPINSKALAEGIMNY